MASRRLRARRSARHCRRRDAIETALDAFRGTFLQTPPPYSAKKVGGPPCVRAREAFDTHVELRPVEVTVHRARDRSRATGSAVQPAPGVHCRLLRAFAGARPGPGAGLRGASAPRFDESRAGGFSVEDAITLTDAREWERSGKRPTGPTSSDAHWAMPALRLSEDGTRRVEHGNVVQPRHLVHEVISRVRVHARAACGRLGRARRGRRTGGRRLFASGGGTGVKY